MHIFHTYFVQHITRDVNRGRFRRHRTRKMETLVMPMYSQRLSPAIFASTPAGGGDRGSLSLRSTSLGIEATRFIQKKTGNNRLLAEKNVKIKSNFRSDSRRQSYASYNRWSWSRLASSLERVPSVCVTCELLRSMNQNATTIIIPNGVDLYKV